MLESYSALLRAFVFTLVLLLGIAIVTLVGKWKVYAKLGMPGWYSLIPVFSDYKLCERVRGGEENKTFLMGNSDKDFEKSNQCAFDAYCKVILRNEARDAYDQRKRKLKREQLFGEMSPEELNKLITTDRYFQFERDIVEDGLHFIVCDQGVYDALMTLPGAKRKIVLLSYFGEMNDREIGNALGTGRANVQYHRSRALAMMRKTLEQESEEY